jgi:hypothetical protein
MRYDNVITWTISGVLSAALFYSAIAGAPTNHFVFLLPLYVALLLHR